MVQAVLMLSVPRLSMAAPRTRAQLVVPSETRISAPGLLSSTPLLTLSVVYPHTVLTDVSSSSPSLVKPLAIVNCQSAVLFPWTRRVPPAATIREPEFVTPLLPAHKRTPFARISPGPLSASDLLVTASVWVPVLPPNTRPARLALTSRL